MIIQKAERANLDTVAEIYSRIHTEEENGKTSTGWIRGIYPTRKTAEDALLRKDLFVGIDKGKVIGSAIINQTQPKAYYKGHWDIDAPEEKTMILHTLVVDPQYAGNGYGKAFIKNYEEYALSQGCPYLRIDTQEQNQRARSMYRNAGYMETDIVPCVFNGIDGVQLVLLEKYCGR